MTAEVAVCFAKAFIISLPALASIRARGGWCEATVQQLAVRHALWMGPWLVIVRHETLVLEWKVDGWGERKGEAHFHRDNWEIMRQTWVELEEGAEIVFPYMEGGSLLSVQGLGDKHVAADGVYVVDPARWLIGTCSCDAVADADVLVLIRADLGTEPEKKLNKGENLIWTKSTKCSEHSDIKCHFGIKGLREERERGMFDTLMTTFLLQAFLLCWHSAAQRWTLNNVYSETKIHWQNILFDLLSSCFALPSWQILCRPWKKLKMTLWPAVQYFSELPGSMMWKWFTPYSQILGVMSQLARSTFNTSAVISHAVQNVTFKEWYILLWATFSKSSNIAMEIKTSILLAQHLADFREDKGGRDCSSSAWSIDFQLASRILLSYHTIQLR